MFGVMAREKLEIPAVIAELDRNLLCNIYAYSFVLSLLCNPIDGSPPGSPVPGILLARVLEWVAISFWDNINDEN